MNNSYTPPLKQHRYGKILRTLILVAATAAPVGSAMARGEVSLVNTTSVPAVPSSYIVDDSSYRWGLGVDLKIESFVYQDQTLAYNPIQPDRVQIVRIDNPNATGEPCAIYAETAGTARQYQATLPGTPGDCPLAEIIAGNVANIGALDVFTNAGPWRYSHKNIERVDLIYSQGIIAPSSELALAGHTVLEKSGNNPIQIAAILSLGADGQPDAYGPLVRIHESGYADTTKVQYGITNIYTLNDFLSNSSKSPNGFMVARSSQPEALGFAFVSLLDLGIAPGQKYYGISAFAKDIDPDQHDLTAPETFPRDTSSHNDIDDADFHLGTGGNLQLAPINQPPLAQPDNATANTGEPVDIAPLSNDSDPENDPLQLTISKPPAHGTATVIGEVIRYTSDTGFSGDDFLIYQISDGNGGSSEARIQITVTPLPGTRIPASTPTPTAVLADTGSAQRLIETGLQGHGAGSLGWLLAPLALVGLRRHRLATRAQQ